MALDVQKLEQDAMKALQRGKDQDALKIYLRILQHDGRSRRIRKTVAELHLKLGQKKQAERRFLEVVESMLKDGQHRQAIQIYKELTRLRPKDHEMFVELGDCHAKCGFSNDAIEMYVKAVEMTGRLKPDVAQDIQRKIIALKPAEFSEKIKLAELLEHANWAERAADEWKALAEQSRQLGKPEDQARFLERAIQMKPDTDGYTLAAKARLQTGEPIRSLELLQRVEKEDKRQAKVLELFGEALMAVGQSQKAQKLWLQAADSRGKERNVQRRLHDLRQAVECGVSDPEIKKAISKADEQLARASLRLHAQDWAQPKNEDEMRVFIRSRVMMDYKLFEHAKTTLQKCNKKIQAALSIQTLLVEALIELNEISAAAELLQGLRVRSTEATEQIGIRLAVITGADDDDELNNDYLESPDPYFLDMVGETDHSQETAPEVASDAAQSTSVKSLQEKAETLVLEGKIDAAVDLYTKICEIDPDNDSALIRIGELMAMDMDEDEEYREELQNQGFSDIDPSDFDPSRFNLSSNEDEAEDLDDISEEASEVAQASKASIIEDSDEVKTARAHFLVGQYAEAAEICKEIPSLASAILFSSSMRRLGKLRVSKSHLQDQMDAVEENHPQFTDAIWELIQIYVKGKKSRSILRLLDDLQDIDPDFRAKEVEALRLGVTFL